ncbi:GNAT family N-acetyltransferase [archaeon]|jgi:GNAT superfamily N-acetyltransferase|nr:GNAT family N-acetyltransferase [archaeon]MBT6734967.1 GNAT family N-acetyltransferase [Candidatus Woesearchaeota archaeon]
MSKLIFRETKSSDLGFLDEIRGEELHKLHLDRFENQKKGFVKYLIVFNGKNPIGHVLITFKNFYSWHKFPAIEDLYVKKEERKKKFAKQIMGYAEFLVKTKGHNKICLDVETHEFWIRSFYESLGYEKISGVHDLKYFVERNGINEECVEKVNYFEKSL